MHLGDQVRAGLDEALVAALELGPAEVVGAEAEQLQVRAHGAVEDDDALAQRLQVACDATGRADRGVRGRGPRSDRIPVPPVALRDPRR